MGNMHIMDRRLPERANLSFFFSNPIEGEPYFVVRMPFFENPKITESKRAKYKKHSLLARSSNLYTYLGAESKKLDLTFSITLPHILEEHPDVVKDTFMSNLRMTFGEDEQRRFLSPTHPEPQVGVTAASYRNNYFLGKGDLKGAAMTVLRSIGLTPEEVSHITSLYDISNKELKENEQAFKNSLNSFFGTIAGGQVIENMETAIPSTSSRSARVLDENRQRRLELIDIIIYWINIIRCSVINHAKNPLHGPPIIRLNHGLLYQDIPCICTDYRVDWDERAGYDLETLLPRKLNIKLNLEEFRTGNFKAFDPNEIIERDNLAGWESVISEGQNLDPGYNVYMKDE